MMPTGGGCVNRLLLLLVPLLLAGCTGAHRYGLPRTLPPGKSAQVFSFDLARGAEGRSDTLMGDGMTVDRYGLAPVFAYDLRSGLADGIELGVGISSDIGARLDTKLELFRSTFFDAAVAPSLSAYMGGLPMLTIDEQAHSPTLAATLPLLLGIHTEDFYVVPAAGISWLHTASRQRILGSGGVTLFARIQEGLWMGPGITVTGPGANGADSIYGGGVSVVLGDPYEGSDT